MADRLISADELQKTFNEVSSGLLAKPKLSKDAEHIVRACLMVTQMINDAPTVEAEPIKHGRWLIGVGENGEPMGTYCSECGWSWERNIAAIQLNKVLSWIETPRCPYCGAIMDKVK